MQKTNIMAKGKQTCKILKEIRKQIAEENDIEFVTSECTHKGDCAGTCPKCEAEVRYLERELEKRQRLGKAAVFAGMSLGTALTAASCGPLVQPLAGMPADFRDTITVADTNQCTHKPDEPLAGDVVSIAPERRDPDTIIEEPLMGIVPLYQQMFSFDSEYYQKHMKEKFVIPEMEDLMMISGNIEYEHIGGKGKPCDNLDELVENAEVFKAPYYFGGEKKFREAHAVAWMGFPNIDKYVGDIEVAFTVGKSGQVSEVEIVKGLDEILDAAVSSDFLMMTWEPAEYKLKDESWSFPFECRCVKKIHFPMR
jgi:hypothetical protein